MQTPGIILSLQDIQDSWLEAVFASNPTWIKHSDLLHHAVLANRYGLVAFLLKQGVNVDSRDHQDKTPLHYAAEDPSHLRILELLLQHGAELLPDKKGNTPLHEATLKGDLEIIKRILEHSKRPNFTMRNCDQKTVIDIALEKSFYDALHQFLGCHTAIIDLDVVKRISSTGNLKDSIYYATYLCLTARGHPIHFFSSVLYHNFMNTIWGKRNPIEENLKFFESMYNGLITKNFYIAKEIIFIFSTLVPNQKCRKSESQATSSTVDSDNILSSLSLYLLKMLDEIVTNFVDLIPSVIEILSKTDDGKLEFSTYNLNLLVSHQHAALYLAILEKIQKNGYAEQVRNMFAMSSSQDAKKPFAIVLMQKQATHNFFKLLNVLEENVKLTEHCFKIVRDGVDLTSLFDNHDFLSQLHQEIVKIWFVGSPELYSAYMKLLETIYNSNQNNQIPAYLFQIFDIYNRCDSHPTTLTGRFVYLLACSNKNVDIYMSRLKTTAQKQVVLDYIKNLPQKERIQACQNASNARHPLGGLFCDASGIAMRTEFRRLLVQDTVERKVKNPDSLERFIQHKSVDDVIDLIFKFKEFINNDVALTKFISILPNKQCPVLFLENLFQKIIERNEGRIFEAYLKLLETIYALSKDFTSDKKTDIAKMACQCLELANSKRSFFGSKLVLNSKQISYQAEMGRILDRHTKDFDAIKSFLNSLFKSPLTPAEIIDLLEMTDNRGWRLDAHISTSFTQGPNSVIHALKGSLPTVYFNLLHYLLDERNADSQKIANLLTFRNGQSPITPFAHNLVMVPEIILFLDLVKKLPVLARLQIFSEVTVIDKTLLENYLHPAIDSKVVNNLVPRCLAMLHQDVLLNKETATQVLGILSHKNIGAKLLGNASYNSSSLSFLKILDCIISNYSELALSVVDILSDSQNATIGSKVLTRSDEHVALYISILEKIQTEGHIIAINQLLFDFGSNQENQFLIQFVKSQGTARDLITTNNAVRMFNLLERHIKNAHSTEQTKTLVECSVSGNFFNALGQAVRERNYLSKAAVAYLELLETMYATSRNLDMISYYFQYRSISNLGSYTLRSGQLAYELACSFDSLKHYSYMNCFAAYEQQAEVVAYIRDLPEEERKQAIKNISSPSHSLHSYFNAFYNNDIWPEIHRQLGFAFTEIQIDSLLSQEIKDSKTVASLLQSLADSKHDPNMIIETLSRIEKNNDDGTNEGNDESKDSDTKEEVSKGKHLGFYLNTPENIDVYFQLLKSLLDKKDKILSLKVSRLLNFQDKDNRTICHHFAFTGSFFNLIASLDRDCRVHLLSTLLSSRELIIGPYDFVVKKSLELLTIDLQHYDLQAAKYLLNIFSSAQNLIADILSTEGLSSAFLKMIQSFVVQYEKLIPQVAALLQVVTLDFNIRPHVYLFADILTGIQAHIDGEQFAKLLSHSQQNNPPNKNFLASVLEGNETQIAIKVISLLEAHVKKIGLQQFVATFPIGLINFLDELNKFAEKVKSVALYKACLNLHEVLHPQDQNIIAAVDCLKLEGYISRYILVTSDVIASPNLAYYLACNGILKDMSKSEQQKKVVLDHIKTMPLDDRITVYRQALSSGELYEFFEQSNNSILDEMRTLLRRDLLSKGLPVTTLYANREEMETKIPINYAITSRNDCDDFSPL